MSPSAKPKFRFGISGTGGGSPEASREFARKAEELGFSTIVSGDHMGRSNATLLNLLDAAHHTKTIRIGTQVIANDFRHPQLLAKEIATLDLLSGGRFEPGIGVGWPATSATGLADYAQLGIKMDEQGIRVSRFEESFRLIRNFLRSDEPIDFEGKYYTAKGLVTMPRPIQKPNPPMLIAGAGPRLLKFAARHADIIDIAPRPPIHGLGRGGSMGYGLTMEDSIQIIREAAGDRFEMIEIAMFGSSTTITNDPEPRLKQLEETYNVNREQLLMMPAIMVGDIDYIVDRMQEHRDKYGLSYRIIQGDIIDQFAPVVAKLAGT